MGTILGGEPAASLLCGFAFAIDRHEKCFFAHFSTHILRADLLEFQCQLKEASCKRVENKTNSHRCDRGSPAMHVAG